MAHQGPNPEKDGPHTESPGVAPYPDREEKASVDPVASRDSSDSVHRKSESAQDEERRTGLEPAQTYATTASALTGTESQAAPGKKPWYKKVNPMRWGGIPPVPEARTASPEHNASFFSLVYFQWVAPIMKVSPIFYPAFPYIVLIVS